MSKLIERTWEEFRNAGALWWANRALHIFGWAIVVELNRDDVVRIYPARSGFRGFSPDVESQGFKALTGYMVEMADSLLEDCNEN